MTEIDFYKVAGGDHRSRDRFACRLAEKVFKLGKGVFVHTDSASHARALDDLLWTWKQGSFVPHELAADNTTCAVLIGHDREPDGQAQQVLINLSVRVPDFAACFERVAEIVNDEADIRDAGRGKYRHYQERGFALRYHDLSVNPETDDEPNRP